MFQPDYTIINTSQFNQKQNLDQNIPCNPFSKRLFSKKPVLVATQVQTDQIFTPTQIQQSQKYEQTIFEDQLQIKQNNEMFKRITQQLYTIRDNMNQRIRMNKVRKIEQNVSVNTHNIELIVANMKSYFEQILFINPTNIIESNKNPQIIETIVCYEPDQVPDHHLNREKPQQDSHENQNIQQSIIGNISYFKKSNINNTILADRQTSRRGGQYSVNQKIDYSSKNDQKQKSLNATSKIVLEEPTKKSSVYELILNEQRSKLKKSKI